MDKRKAITFAKSKDKSDEAKPDLLDKKSSQGETALHCKITSRTQKNTQTNHYLQIM